MRILLLILLFSPSLLSAATFTVSSTADTSNPGSLRWAIEQHNSQGGDNRIEFDPALAGETIFLTSNLPLVVFNTLEVDGNAAPGLAIDANTQGRIFILGSNSNGFTVQNLKLQNSDGLFGGGCIRATGGGNLEVRVINVVFERCEQESFANPTNSFSALGGAILTELGADGVLDIRGSQFISNRVYGTEDLLFGGAVYADGGRVDLINNVFELNTSDNLDAAAHQGGAVYVRDADVGLIENEFLFNQADEGEGGAVVLNLRPENVATINRNLFAGNRAGLGAALWTATQVQGSDWPFFGLANNTFLANTSTRAPGGAIYFREAETVIRNNSFIDNVNLSSGAAHLAYNPSETDFFSVWNNLFTTATSDACSTFNNNPPATFSNAGYNLLPDMSCMINGFNDLVADAGRFFPLADYGGATRTVPPADGNLAIDNANPNPINSANSALCRFTDARDIDRPGDGDGDGTAVCDMGAFEWKQEAPLFFDGFERVGLVIP